MDSSCCDNAFFAESSYLFRHELDILSVEGLPVGVRGSDPLAAHGVGGGELGRRLRVLHHLPHIPPHLLVHQAADPGAEPVVGDYKQVEEHLIPEEEADAQEGHCEG